jgi:protein tyrosine phosphatase (PTP) superfamily phosphohydrolase (DUF442 family)
LDVKHRIFRRCVAVALVGLACVAGGCSHSADSKLAQQVDQTGRPTAWGKPVTAPGLHNTYKFNDTIYRGAQPTAEGFRQLEAMGVKTVVSIRATDKDRPLLQGTGLNYVWIPMEGFAPDHAAVEKFLTVTSDKRFGPYFVHCQHGSDRTGFTCALVRVVHEGWDKEDAIAEMRGGEYGFNDIFFQNLVSFVRDFDVEGFRARQQLAHTAASPTNVP